MEHRALALEYRPQSFDDVAGQNHVITVLSRALGHGRVHHCYLFSGPRGVGKTTTARILAKILNCPNVKDGKPCNECDVCRDVTAGVSLDVQEIDGASNRGIADVQQLRERVRFTPSGGRYRVVIIDEVHQLSGDAFAALLKTLEEPPPHVVFVFATTDPLKLPDTIRSRCQRYDFGRIPMPAVVTRLREIAKGESSGRSKVTLTDEAAFLLARKSEGSMRDAVSAFDQVLSTGVTKVDEAAVNEVLGLVSREVFFELGETILGRNPQGALAALHRAYREGVDPRDLAEGMLEHLRSHLVLKVDPKAEDLVVASDNERQRYEGMSGEHETHDLLRLMRLVTETLGAMRESAQPLTHLEVAVVEMASLEPGVRLAEILERLGAMPRGGPVSDGGNGGGRKAATAKKPAPAGRRSTPAPKRADDLAPGSTVMDAVAPAVAPPLSAPAPPVYPPVASSPSSAPPIAEVVDGIAVGTATAVAEAEDENGEWEEVVRRVKERKLMVGVFLDESRRMGWDGAILKLAADEVHRSLLEAVDNRDLLSKTLSDVYGRAVRVKFVEAPPRVRPAPVAGSQAQSRAPKGYPAVSSPPVHVERTSPPPAPQPVAQAAAPVTVIAQQSSAAEPTVSPLVEKAMVWFEGEIVQQTEPGGPGT
jgi:DNA polymerase-3 subunit gamma/tau